MDSRGTCLQSYIPIRKDATSASEMVSSLIFGESFDVLEYQSEWIKIKTHFDQYQGWIGANTFSAYIEFEEVNDCIFLEAFGDHKRIFIPCGGRIPAEGTFELNGEKYSIERKLKTNHHLPLNLRLIKTAQSFLNCPYLWGGRTFMGIDCSGFMQVLFKSNGIFLERDTSKQIGGGLQVEYKDIHKCDLVFFSNPESGSVSHVGMAMDNNHVIHASGKVKINFLNETGMEIDDKQAYKTITIKRYI